MDSLSIELACSERGSKRAQRALLFTFLMKLTGDSLLKYVLLKNLQIDKMAKLMNCGYSNLFS